MTACAWLIETAPAAAEPGVWVMLPGELAEPAAAILRRYVLRAKLSISTADAHAPVHAWLADHPVTLDALLAPDASAPAELAVCHRSDATWLRAGSRRALSIATGDPDHGTAAASPPAGMHIADGPSFELAAVRDGEPVVVAATREHWVPQMLNLDLIGGISFAKGCYTGQEIVTRTQHRGQIKRRMLRYAALDTVPPAPGDSILSAAGKAGEVVRAAADGSRAELLAVVSLDHATSPLHLENGTVLLPQPLPYSLDQERGAHPFRG
ncbi:MAG: hypothetical protein IT483_02355 [Gammaproteobacteria bacterium]|nr:hypothetical protein [Gammaproteobacteria bacterium]